MESERSLWRWRTPDPESIQARQTKYLKHSLRRNRRGWAWAWRFVERSSNATTASSLLPRPAPRARCFEWSYLPEPLPLTTHSSMPRVLRPVAAIRLLHVADLARRARGRFTCTKQGQDWG